MFADEVSVPAALFWLQAAGTDPITGSFPKAICQPLYVRMFTPFSALMQAFTWAASAAVTPCAASIDRDRCLGRGGVARHACEHQEER